MQIVSYQTEEEAQVIIEQKTAEGLILVAVSNITEGNFLGFMSNPVIPPTSVEERFAELNESQLILMDVLATMYEDMLAKGTV